MSLKKHFLLACSFLLAFPALHAQLLIKEHLFVFSRIDHANCSSQRLEIDYPEFSFKNGQPLTEVNDSILKIVRAEAEVQTRIFDLYDFPDRTDTSIRVSDTVAEFKCGPTEFTEDMGALNCTISINNNHLLSFYINSAFYAGGNGEGSMQSVYPLCYDLEEKKWLPLPVLFTGKYDRLLVKRADSIYSAENRTDAANEKQLTRLFCLENDRIIFFYVDRSGGESFPHDVFIPYEIYAQHLSPRYRKLLQPSK